MPIRNDKSIVYNIGYVGLEDNILKCRSVGNLGCGRFCHAWSSGYHIPHHCISYYRATSVYLNIRHSYLNSTELSSSKLSIRDTLNWIVGRRSVLRDLNTSKHDFRH